MTARKNVPVFIVGGSGTGKSSCFGVTMKKNGEIAHYGLPPDKTILLNIEDKEIPVMNAGNFESKLVSNIRELNQILRMLENIPKMSKEENAKWDEAYKENPRRDPRTKEFLVIDGMTAVTSLINKFTSTLSGYKAWAKYNEMVEQFIEQLKKIPMQVFITAIDEQKDVESGDTISYAKIRGKELKYGYMESQFTVVLFTKPVYNTQTSEIEDIFLEYRVNTKNKAKSPEGMFNGDLPNDAYAVYMGIQRYYKKAHEIEWKDEYSKIKT